MAISRETPGIERYITIFGMPLFISVASLVVAILLSLLTTAIGGEMYLKYGNPWGMYLFPLGFAAAVGWLHVNYYRKGIGFFFAAFCTTLFIFGHFVVLLLWITYITPEGLTGFYERIDVVIKLSAIPLAVAAGTGLAGATVCWLVRRFADKRGSLI